jgi:uncharacterized NAD-dependent epimerase/dehydratase family protein
MSANTAATARNRDILETSELPRPYLLFLGDTVDPTFAKTAFGLRDWAGDLCIGEWACEDASVTLGLPRIDPAAARLRGARSLIIGVANIGGAVNPRWIPRLVEALEAGLDIVSGMHTPLGSIEQLAAAACQHGRRLIDVRRAPRGIPIASGLKRSGRRLLTVGTDCALGKKYTALALTCGFVSRGVDACFRATGQTGIMISGSGIPMDAVIADFAAGAAEILSPDAGPEHWDVIEGQGSLLHPAYAGVSLALLHGSQPDVFVVCHQPSRTHMVGHPERPMPDLQEVIELTLRLGRCTNTSIRCGGISLDTSRMGAAAARRLLRETGRHYGLATADPMREGPELEQLIDACLA